MRDLAILAIHLIATIAKLLLSGGARTVLSESLLLKRQLLILNRSSAALGSSRHRLEDFRSVHAKAVLGGLHHEYSLARA